MFDEKGNPYGTQFKISTTVDYPVSHPSVAMLDDGTNLVVWQSLGQDGDGYGIYGQFLTSSQKIGGEFQINTYIQGDQMFPTVSPTDQYFVVIWQSPDSDGNGIYAKIFNNLGIESGGPEILVNQNQTNDQTHPFVGTVMMINSTNSTNFFNIIYCTVTWMTYGNSENSSPNGIYAREISFSDINGNYSFGYKDEFLVSGFSQKPPSYPIVAMSISNPYAKEILYVIVWQADQVMASLFSTLKGPIKTNIQVNSRTNLDQNLQFLPSVGLNLGYGFAIAYQMNAFDSEDLDIYAQIFDLNGEKTGDEMLVNVYQLDDQKFPFVRMNGNNQIIYTWVSKNFNKSGNSLNFQIYSQEVARPYLLSDGA